MWGVPVKKEAAGRVTFAESLTPAPSAYRRLLPPTMSEPFTHRGALGSLPWC